MKLKFVLLLALVIASESSCWTDLSTAPSERNKVAPNSPTPITTPAKSNLAESEVNGPRGELKRFRKLWKTKKIGSYDFEASLYAGGTRYFAEPVRIQVRDSKTVSVQPVDKNNQGSVAGYSEFATVDKIFDVIEAAIDKNKEVKATYNKEFGYPDSILSDASSSVTDAYERFTIHRFRIIKRSDP